LRGSPETKMASGPSLSESVPDHMPECFYLNSCCFLAIADKIKTMVSDKVNYRRAQP